MMASHSAARTPGDLPTTLELEGIQLRAFNTDDDFRPIFMEKGTVCWLARNCRFTGGWGVVKADGGHFIIELEDCDFHIVATSGAGEDSVGDYSIGMFLVDVDGGGELRIRGGSSWNDSAHCIYSYIGNSVFIDGHRFLRSGGVFGPYPKVGLHIYGGTALDAWTASHAYAVGKQVTNGGNVYEVTAVTGTAMSAGGGATGPLSMLPDITDNEVTWKWMNAGTSIFARYCIVKNCVFERDCYIHVTTNPTCPNVFEGNTHRIQSSCMAIRHFGGHVTVANSTFVAESNGGWITGDYGESPAGEIDSQHNLYSGPAASGIARTGATRQTGTWKFADDIFDCPFDVGEAYTCFHANSDNEYRRCHFKRGAANGVKSHVIRHEGGNLLLDDCLIDASPANYGSNVYVDSKNADVLLTLRRNRFYSGSAAYSSLWIAKKSGGTVHVTGEGNEFFGDYFPIVDSIDDDTAGATGITGDLVPKVGTGPDVTPADPTQGPYNTTITATLHPNYNRFGILGTTTVVNLRVADTATSSRDMSAIFGGPWYLVVLNAAGVAFSGGNMRLRSTANRAQYSVLTVIRKLDGIFYEV